MVIRQLLSFTLVCTTKKLIYYWLFVILVILATSYFIARGMPPISTYFISLLGASFDDFILLLMDLSQPFCHNILFQRLTVFCIIDISSLLLVIFHRLVIIKRYCRFDNSLLECLLLPSISIILSIIESRFTLHIVEIAGYFD